MKSKIQSIFSLSESDKSVRSLMSNFWVQCGFHWQWGRSLWGTITRSKTRRYFTLKRAQVNGELFLPLLCCQQWHGLGCGREWDPGRGHGEGEKLLMTRQTRRGVVLWQQLKSSGRYGKYLLSTRTLEKGDLYSCQSAGASTHVQKYKMKLVTWRLKLVSHLCDCNSLTSLMQAVSISHLILLTSLILTKQPSAQKTHLAMACPQVAVTFGSIWSWSILPTIWRLPRHTNGR